MLQGAFLWAVNSAGRVPPRQGGSRWFEPNTAHHYIKTSRSEGFACFFIFVGFSFTIKIREHAILTIAVTRLNPTINSLNGLPGVTSL